MADLAALSFKLPNVPEGMLHVFCVSGGKDSEAMWAWARRKEIAPRVIAYQDTQWEATKPGINHYQHLDALEQHFGEQIVRIPSRGMRELVRHKGIWPGRLKRKKWCTHELKLLPFADWLGFVRGLLNCETTVYVAVRREESSQRERLVEREHSDLYDCDVVRPCLDWTVEDVFREINQAGAPIHPLYRAGAERVGCWPCVKAAKAELALFGRLDPERVSEVEIIERETGNFMFTLEEPTVDGVRGKCVPTPIREVIDWANTEYGGKQRRLLPVVSGCERWGFCDAGPRRGA